MSLFIFKNRTLYADTRKVVNFPDGPMLGGMIETKVKDYGWGKLAISGYEETRRKDLILQRLLTWYSGLAFINEYIKLAGNVDGGNLKFKEVVASVVKDLGAAADSYIESRRIESFMGITKYSVISSQNSQAMRVSHASDCLEVVGSCQGAAQQLVLHDTPPKEVYKILRLADVPVGGPIEEHSIDDLDDLYPPINSHHFWVLMVKFIISENSGNFDDERLYKIVSIAHNSYKFFKKESSGAKLVPNLETFRNLNNLLEVPEGKEFNSTKNSILKILKDKYAFPD